jgi:hypothetical protein
VVSIGSRTWRRCLPHFSVNCFSDVRAAGGNGSLASRTGQGKWEGVPCGTREAKQRRGGGAQQVADGGFEAGRVLFEPIGKLTCKWRRCKQLQVRTSHCKGTNR